MYRKRMPIVSIMLGLSLLLSSCIGTNPPEQPKPLAVPVKTVLVEESEYNEVLHYVGIVDAGQLARLSFKTSGRIEEIFVNDGDWVFKGDKLASIETPDLRHAVEIAGAAMIKADASLVQAEKALTFAERNHVDMKRLYDEGAISKQSYDKAELDLESAKSGYEIALGVYRQAAAIKEQNIEMLSEATLVSPFEGQVIEILSEQGEMTVPGHPSFIIANDEKTVYVGVSQDDVQKIQPEMQATVNFEKTSISGIVRNITYIPDSGTRTYQIAITIPNTPAPVGSVCDVDISIGIRRGIMIPIDSILSSNGDYVYLVEDGVAVQTRIDIADIYGLNVFASGLSDGDELVVEGMKNLTNGSIVEVENE